MYYNELVPARASVLVPHADRLRLAMVAYLARFKGTPTTPAPICTVGRDWRVQSAWRLALATRVVDEGVEAARLFAVQDDEVHATDGLRVVRRPEVPEGADGVAECPGSSREREPGTRNRLCSESLKPLPGACRVRMDTLPGGYPP